MRCQKRVGVAKLSLTHALRMKGASELQAILLGTCPTIKNRSSNIVMDRPHGENRLQRSIVTTMYRCFRGAVYWSEDDCGGSLCWSGGDGTSVSVLVWLNGDETNEDSTKGTSAKAILVVFSFLEEAAVKAPAPRVGFGYQYGYLRMGEKTNRGFGSFVICCGRIVAHFSKETIRETLAVKVS